MNLTAEQIEYIIREVMRRLAELGVTGATTTRPSSELALADRLVTLRSVEGKLTNITKVTVGSRAVVTPAVRDLLREKKIEFARRSA
jgi:hypothetical protein